ncbi:hypothetical protein HOC80_01890 [archaeon]|jgi:hypothetical protein|nr:hypothetical protein [archaeon]MBT4416833.1 hypothetical protein [archaeon]
MDVTELMQGARRVRAELDKESNEFVYDRPITANNRLLEEIGGVQVQIDIADEQGTVTMHYLTYHKDPGVFVDITLDRLFVPGAKKIMVFTPGNIPEGYANSGLPKYIEGLS